MKIIFFKFYIKTIKNILKYFLTAKKKKKHNLVINLNNIQKQEITKTWLYMLIL
jgi:hypothetical protein